MFLLDVGHYDSLYIFLHYMGIAVFLGKMVECFSFFTICNSVFLCLDWAANLTRYLTHCWRRREETDLCPRGHSDESEHENKPEIWTLFTDTPFHADMLCWILKRLKYKISHCSLYCHSQLEERKNSVLF